MNRGRYRKKVLLINVEDLGVLRKPNGKLHLFDLCGREQ